MVDSNSLLTDEARPAMKYSYISFVLLSLRISSIYFIDSIPLTFTYYMLGSRGDLYLTSTLGLGLTVQCFSFSFIYGFGDAIGILGSRLYGAGKHSEYTVLFGKTMVLMLTCLIVSETSIILSPITLRALGIREDLSARVVWFLRCNMAERAIDCFNTIGRCVIVSQELSWVFLYMNVICLSVFFITSTTCFTVFHMGVGGYVIARYGKTITEFILQIYFMMNYAEKEMLYVPKLSAVFSGIHKILPFYLYSGFGIYGEIMAVEASSQFAAYSGDLSQLSAYVSLLNIIYFLGSIALGMNNTLRTHCNIEKGRKDITKMFWTAKLYYKYAICTAIGFSFLVFTFAYKIASVFTTDRDTIGNLTHILRIYAFILPVDFNMGFSGTFLRTLDKANQLFYCNAIYFPSIMMVSASITTYGYHLGNNGLLASYILSVGSTYSIVLTLLYRTIKTYDVDKLEDSQQDIIPIEKELL